MAITSGEVLAELKAYGQNTAGSFTGIRAHIKHVAAENHTDTNQGAYISFFTTPIASTTLAEVARFTDTGRFGIGTTAPNKLVEIVTQSADSLRLTSYNNGAAAGTFQCVKGRGTLSSPLRTKSGDSIAGFNGFGFYAADDVSAGTLTGLLAQFLYVAAENFTSTNQGTFWKLNTTAIGATSPVQRVQIDENGITLADAHNLVTGTTTGMKIGTVGGASGQKLGFFNQTPIVQPLLATGAGKVVDDVITVLQNLGLCRQS